MKLLHLRRVALTLGAVIFTGSIASAQTTPFSQDVAEGINRGLNFLRASNAFTTCHSTLGLVTLALLEKRQSADWTANINGYSNSTAADQVLLRSAIGLILNNCSGIGVPQTNSYYRGENLMAVSL